MCQWFCASGSNTRLPMRLTDSGPWSVVPFTVSPILAPSANASDTLGLPFASVDGTAEVVVAFLSEWLHAPSVSAATATSATEDSRRIRRGVEGMAGARMPRRSRDFVAPRHRFADET